MISLTKTDDIIKFTFSGNSSYLNNGTIEVPVNSLSLTIDDSNMVTFKKSASNDIFLSALVSDFGMTKNELETYFKENMVGSTADTEALKGIIDKSITSIDIPSGTTSVGSYTFYDCSGLTSVTIPDSVTSIGDYAFNSCSGLTIMTIHATTPPTLGTYAMLATNDCYICVPADSVDAYKSAWSGDVSTDRIYAIPTGVKFSATYSGGKTYSEDCDLTNILTTATTKPEGYTYQAMTSAVIGDCVQIIDKNAFRKFSYLTSVTIGNGVTTISGNVFDSCSRLTSITIPDNVTTIGDSAFMNCRSLTSITIPSGVTSISNSLFKGCSGLTSVDIPDSVTSITGSAFSGCSSLSNIAIPDSVTSIGNSAFKGCTSLTSCTIGSGATSIGDSDFRDCSSLTSLTISAITPPTLGIYVFVGTPIANGNGYIYVPSDSVDAYKEDENWSTYADRIQAISE